MDIAHDRAGYYLCWGCLTWVPGIYTSPAVYLVRHPTHLSSAYACTLLVVGLALIYINWEADDQRQRFRESNGQCLIWGRKPDMIVAMYRTGAELLSLEQIESQPYAVLHCFAVVDSNRQMKLVALQGSLCTRDF
jgi:hypothetical protein